MFIIDDLMIGGLRFVLDKIVTATEAELKDDTALREQLLEAQMRFELGEIDEAEFVAIERDILARIREMKGTGQGPLTMSADDKVSGVDIETFDTRD
jgi:Gas vesicle protein G